MGQGALCRTAQRIPLTIKSSDPSEATISLPADCALQLDVAGRASLHKSVEAAILEDLRTGPFGAQIAENNISAPRYFLHGWHAPLDMANPALELWTSHASHAHWPAMYCHAWRVNVASPRISLAPAEGEDPAAWSDCPSRAVIGYVYLLGILDEAFHGGAEPRMWSHRPSIDYHNKDEAMRPLIARRNYYTFADLTGHPPGVPDAFVFTAEAAKVSGLKVLRTYTLLNPHAQQDEKM